MQLRLVKSGLQNLMELEVACLLIYLFIVAILFFITTQTHKEVTEWTFVLVHHLSHSQSSRTAELPLLKSHFQGKEHTTLDSWGAFL